MFRFTFPMALLTLFFVGQVAAETLVLEPQKDNTLFENSQGSLSNGAGNYLFMGRTGGDKGVDRKLRRALLSFDLSSIPLNADIISVELQLTIDNVALGASAGVSSVHRLLSDWGEGASHAAGPEGQGAGAESGDATWIHTFFDNETWLTEGGDFNTSASQNAQFGPSAQDLVFVSSTALIDDVSRWVNQPTSNFGWIVLGDEPMVQNARRFSSRENINIERRPRLTVEYTQVEITRAVPATGLIGMLLLAFLLFITGLTGRRKPV